MNASRENTKAFICFFELRGGNRGITYSALYAGPDCRQAANSPKRIT
jgi:hypothetical protein